MHAAPVLCVLQEHRTGRNDHLLLLLSRCPPRAVNALNSGAEGSVRLQLGVSTYLTPPLSVFTQTVAHSTFKSVPSSKNMVAVTVTACPKLAVVTNTEELIKLQQ